MKKGEIRKQAIIDSAERLFYEKGYENTSIQDILDDLHFSKGGFYHHFDSKITLLEALCEQKTDEVYLRCEAAVRTEGLAPVEKLNAVLSSSSLLSQNSMDFIGLLIRVAYRGGSVMLRDSIKRTAIKRLLPLMDEIVYDGLKKKIFYTPHPDTVGRLILLLGTNLTDEIAERLSGETIGQSELLLSLELLDTYRNAVELLLNAPYGSVEIIDMNRIVEISENILQQNRRLSWSAFHENK